MNDHPPTSSSLESNSRCHGIDHSDRGHGISGHGRGRGQLGNQSHSYGP